jgi:hypothetical protein
MNLPIFRRGKVVQGVVLNVLIAAMPCPAVSGRLFAEFKDIRQF